MTRKKKFLLFTALTVFLLITLVLFSLSLRKSKSEDLPTTSISTPVPQKESLKFTASMFDPSLVSFIGPLGELNGGYEETQTLAGVVINLKPEAVANGKEIPIYAPSEMVLERFSFHNVPEETGTTNWALSFRFNESVTMKIDHITDVPDRIKIATTSSPKDSSAEEFLRTPLRFKAGDWIAQTSGTSLAHNWNIYVYDSSVRNKFVSQARYEADEIGERLVTASCPFNYYSENERAPFLALMGYTKPGQSPTCGDVSRDFAGSLSGMWHLAKDPKTGTKSDRNGNFVTPLSIYKTSANTIIIAQIDNERFEIATNNPTYKDPKEVTTQHCYSLVNQSNRPAGYAFFKIVLPQEMSFASSPNGSCPNQFPVTGAKSYYR